MHIQVHDEVRELQPDVIVERYLDAKYYQHSPDELYGMSDYNSNAKYLADSDQIITLNTMETDDISICTRSRVLGLPASRQMEVVSSPTRRYKIYVGRRILFYLTLQLISRLPMGLPREWLVCSRLLFAECSNKQI